MATLVQSKYGATSVTFDVAPTEGNTILIWQAWRNGTDGGALVSGFTNIAVVSNSASFPRSGRMSYRVVPAAYGNPAHSSSSGIALVAMEWAGTYASFVAASDVGSTADIVCGGSITPTAGAGVAIIGGASIGNSDNDGANPGMTPNASIVELEDSKPGEFSPGNWLGYRLVAAASGSYTIGGTYGKSQAYCGVTVVMAGPPLAAAFSGTPLTGTRPLAVQFTDLTTKVPTSWEWDFGDSSVSTEQHPLHVYAEAGTYTVTLIASNATDTDTETKVAYVVASIPTASDPTDSPTAGWWVDWGDDGFDAAGSSGNELARSLPQSTGATANDDITSKVKSVTWQRGGQADLIGGQTPGGCILTVDNQDGRFNPDNTAGLYYGLLKPGRKVWGGALRTTGTTKGLFGGYLKEVVPIPGPAKEAQLICHDVFGLWKDVRLKVGFSSNRTALEYRKDILTALGVPDAARVLAPEDAELRVSGADEKNAMSVLDRLNQATATRHVIIPADSKNDLYYYRTIGRNDNLGNAVPAATLTDLDITGMSGLRLTLDTIVNYQQVTLHPYVFDAYTRVWEYGDIPFSLSVNTTKTVTAVFGSWVKNPTVVVASSGAAVTAVAVNYGRSLAITLTAAGDANVTLLYVRGQLATELGQTTEFAEDSASQADYDTIREGGSVDVEFIAESGIARAVADAIIGRSSRPRYRPQVTMRNRFDKALTYDVGNVVLQTVDELSLTRRFEIVGCTGSVSQGGKVWDFGWTYLETPLQTTLALFTLNSSVLDGPDLLGF